jgi:DNA-binding protein Fis
MEAYPHVMVRRYLADLLGMDDKRLMNFLLCVSPLTLEEAVCIENKTKGALKAADMMRLQRIGVRNKRYNFK